MRIKAAFHLFPDQNRGDFVEGSGDRYRAVPVYFPVLLVEKDRLQVYRGIKGADVLRLFKPRLKRCFPVQSPVGIAVILTLKPGMKPGIEIRQAFQRVGIHRTEKRIPHGAKLTFYFSTSLGSCRL
jgi:hypothetical protein